MREMLDRVLDARNSSDLFTIWGDIAVSLGATRTTYHLTPAFSSQLGERAVILYRNYTENWMQLYNQPSFRAHDPIPDFIMRSGTVMTWRKAIGRQTLTPDQDKFVKTMNEHGLEDGYGLPFFGPNGREAYASVTLAVPIAAQHVSFARDMLVIGQMAHRRAVQLVLAEHSHPVKLTKRETEVLQWMARGKSNGDIATIMGISPATVDTFIRRVFKKLKVKDRLAGSLAGIARGLVRP